MLDISTKSVKNRIESFLNLSKKTDKIWRNMAQYVQNLFNTRPKTIKGFQNLSQ